MLSTSLSPTLGERAIEAMMGRTHAAAGLAIGFALGAFHQTPLLDSLVIAGISELSALLPDWDLKLKIKHRGLTHSLLALFIIGALVAWWGQPVLTAAVLVGYSSHLFLDMLTVQGIELFYPWHRRVKLLSFRTGSKIDALLCACALSGALWCVISLVRVNL